MPAASQVPQRVLDPYTHMSHAKRCVEAGRNGVVLRQFVQAKMGRTGWCGRIESAWDTEDGREMWRLELIHPQPGLASVPAARVRQCSGLDGLCVCAGEAGRAAVPPAPASAEDVTC